MELTEVLDLLLKRFEHYYSIKKDSSQEPFDAKAEFHSRNEQYFLVKKAKIAEEENHEYVYFSVVETLDRDAVRFLENFTWNKGLAKVNPNNTHRCSDIILIIISNEVTPEAKDYIKKIKRYKSYLFTLRGWSNFRIAVYEALSGEVISNKRGSALSKLFDNLI